MKHTRKIKPQGKHSCAGDGCHLLKHFVLDTKHCYLCDFSCHDKIHNKSSGLECCCHQLNHQSFGFHFVICQETVKHRKFDSKVGFSNLSGFLVCTTLPKQVDKWEQPFAGQTNKSLQEACTFSWYTPTRTLWNLPCSKCIHLHAILSWKLCSPATTWSSRTKIFNIFDLEFTELECGVPQRHNFSQYCGSPAAGQTISLQSEHQLQEKEKKGTTGEGGEPDIRLWVELLGDNPESQALVGSHTHPHIHRHTPVPPQTGLTEEMSERKNKSKG